MAQLPLALVTALRFSKGRKRAGMVSLISIISTLGIMLGVAVLIIGLSAMNGFERELKNRILSVVPHGQIYSVEQPLYLGNRHYRGLKILRVLLLLPPIFY